MSNDSTLSTADLRSECIAFRGTNCSTKCLSIDSTKLESECLTDCESICSTNGNAKCSSIGSTDLESQCIAYVLADVHTDCSTNSVPDDVTNIETQTRIRRNQSARALWHQKWPRRRERGNCTKIWRTATERDELKPCSSR